MGVFGVWLYAWRRRRRFAPLYLVVRFQSDPGWMMGRGGAVQHWWDYVANNVRLGKEEE
jgi:hypothetical protein